MNRRLTLLMAFAAGVSVAGLYYCQPLLTAMQDSLGTTAARMGMVATAAQAGYALGMLFLVPLGDMVNRKRLILVMVALVSLALLWAAGAQSVWSLAAANLTIGVTSMIPQAILPFAARLAPPERRGRVLGTVMSGLLIGILLARTVSGIVGAAFGWRMVYVLAAIMMAALGVLLKFALPNSEPDYRGTYKQLLLSLGALVRRHAVLRESALFGALVFASFSAFWVTLSFHLAGPSFKLGPASAGLFGLLGAAGALAAPLTGRWSDRKSPRFTVGLGLALTAVAFAVFLASGHGLAGLIVGVILMDMGVQMTHVSNQSRIFALEPEAHSRLNTVYMFAYFVGGSLGALAATSLWAAWGWEGVSALGLALMAFAGAAYFAKARAAKAQVPVKA